MAGPEFRVNYRAWPVRRITLTSLSRPVDVHDAQIIHKATGKQWKGEVFKVPYAMNIPQFLNLIGCKPSAERLVIMPDGRIAVPMVDIVGKFIFLKLIYDVADADRHLFRSRPS